MNVMSGLHLNGIFDGFKDDGAGDAANGIRSSIRDTRLANIDNIICNNITNQIRSFSVM